MTGCFSTLNPSTECWKIWVQASYITFVSWLSRYWWTAACATLTGPATETDCGSNCRTCRLPCITESRPTWDQKEDRLETDGGNSGDCWEHLFKCQISMPLKNHFAKKETIKISKLHPREQEVPAFWLLELHCCYCRDLSLSCMWFFWALRMYRAHNISHRQRNMQRQFDLGAVPDNSFCCWECCVTKLSCSAALGLLLSQELWLMETSQKTSAG